MATLAITGTIKKPDGSAWASGVVSITLIDTLRTVAPDVYPGWSDTQSADENGDVAFTLTVPASGAWKYQIELPDGGTAIAYLTAESPTTLAGILAAVGAANSSQTAWEAALLGYEPALGNPGTDGYILSSTTAGVRSWVANVGGGVADVDELTTDSGTDLYMVRVASGGGLEYRSPAQTLSDIGAAASGHAHDIAALAGAAFAGGELPVWDGANFVPSFFSTSGTSNLDVPLLTNIRSYLSELDTPVTLFQLHPNYIDIYKRLNVPASAGIHSFSSQALMLYGDTTVDLLANDTTQMRIDDNASAVYTPLQLWSDDEGGLDRIATHNGMLYYYNQGEPKIENMTTLAADDSLFKADSNGVVPITVAALQTLLGLANYLPLTGGTLTGQLNSSGTDHYGFRLLSLTTAQRDALTPAGGEMIYNSTDSEIQAYDGSTWKTVGSSTGGDVVGPGSSTDNAVARFDGTTGKLLQNSSVTIDDGLPRIRGTRDGYGSWFLFPGSASWSGFSFSKSIIMSESTGKYAVVTNTPGTATIPIFTIRGDTDTGIGTAGDDQLSLIAGNAEAAQVDTNATANQTKMLIKDTAGTLRRVAIYNDGTRDLLYLV